MELQLENDSGELHVEDFYNPFPKQRALHVSEASKLLAIGGNGSGKSAFLLGEAVYTAFEYPGSNSLLLRKDFRQLEKGLILDLRTSVPEFVVDQAGRKLRVYKYNETKHYATWFNNSITFFGHLKNGSERELSQYLSSAFVWIGFDELGQWSYEAWDFLDSRNRINRGCKPNAEGYMPIPRIGGATNPMGPGYGWIKKLWIDKKPVLQLGEVYQKKDGKWYRELKGEEKLAYDPHDHVYVHSTVLDNPVQMERDPRYIEKLEKLAPALREKALYGNLNTQDGAYFNNLQNDRHILSLPRDRERLKWEPWQPVWLGVDWGLAHHTAVFWFTRAKLLMIDGVHWKPIVIAYRQLIVNETGSRDIARQIAEQMPKEEIQRCKHIFLSPDRFGRHEEVGASVAHKMGEVFREYELPWCTPANDRRVDGAVFMYNLLEEGGFVMIEEMVPDMITALQTVVRDTKNLEDVLKTQTIEDDCYDGTRYGLVSMLKEKGKPEAVKQQEELDRIADPIAKQMHSYEQWLQNQKPRSAVRRTIVPRWMKGD